MVRPRVGQGSLCDEAALSQGPGGRQVSVRVLARLAHGYASGRGGEPELVRSGRRLGTEQTPKIFICGLDLRQALRQGLHPCRPRLEAGHFGLQKARPIRLHRHVSPASHHDGRSSPQQACQRHEPPKRTAGDPECTGSLSSIWDHHDRDRPIDLVRLLLVLRSQPATSVRSRPVSASKTRSKSSCEWNGISITPSPPRRFFRRTRVPKASRSASWRA